MSSEPQSPTQSSATTSPPFHAQTYFTFPITHTVNGLLRRFSADSPNFLRHSTADQGQGVYTPPRRHASPFQPPPLYPLSLKGWSERTPASAHLLSRALAEEIRLLVPPRLQLVEEWDLVYSLDQHGSSLGTLYKRCDDYRGRRGGFVLVVRDGGGGIFGAFLTNPPHPTPHYYGTGECFLWRSLILRSTTTQPTSTLTYFLPPPPSSDTTHLQRMTTAGQPKLPPNLHNHQQHTVTLTPPTSNGLRSPSPAPSGTSTPERIRFKAFPYSGVNDYMIFCEQGYLSVGGGDGHYGLWLDKGLENGVSERCLTFGNEALSDEGKAFEVLGVEVWYLGT